MTDAEINRRVAEIEGWHPNANSDHPHACWWFRDDERHGGGPPPYATDWAWCGPLVEKYGIAVEAAIADGRWCGTWFTRSTGYDVWGDTPQRAICLAVIAVKDRQNGLPS